MISIIVDIEKLIGNCDFGGFIMDLFSLGKKCGKWWCEWFFFYCCGGFVGWDIWNRKGRKNIIFDLFI